MTAPQSNSPIDDSDATIPGFEDIAVHLSQQFSTAPTDATSSPATPLPRYLDRPAVASSASSRPTFRVDAAHPGPTRRVSAQTASAPSPVMLKLQQLRAAFGGGSPQTDSETLPHREPLHPRDRFAGDPRDDVRLQWADGCEPWWHFDVEARMVEHETLWIMEQLEAFFLRYLKPVWWDRFVEGIADFLATIRNELVRPVWSFLTAPFRALAHLIPDIDWPWNFELRGANVSVKQSPFRRIVFDSHLASHVVDVLWDDPDDFLAAGQSLSQIGRAHV